MKMAKKWLSLLMSICMIIGIISIGVAVSAVLPGKESLPIHYELYDYYKDINKAISNSTSVASDSPWTVGMKTASGWMYADTYSKTVDRGYVYAWNANCVLGNYPGFAYYYPANYTAGNPLYLPIITPSNIAGDTSEVYKADSAYIFTAPLNGKYTLSKANQDLVYSDELSNWFTQYKNTENLDFGVRITVNDATVWPTDNLSFYTSGWAKFGTKDAADQKIEVPTLTDLELSKGDVLRVEFTSFTPASVYSAQRVTGCVRVSLTELGENDEETDDSGYYEIYDFFENLLTAMKSGEKLNNDSPWSAEFFYDGKWNLPDYFAEEFSYCYAGCSDRPDWGNLFPGVAFHFNKSSSRYQMCMIAPTNNTNGTDYDINASYAFKAPQKGTYTFDKSNPDTVVSFADSQYFGPRNLIYTGIEFGVKIMLNDKQLWPNSIAYKGPTKDGFATFGYEIDGIPGNIPIPKLEGIGMNKDDILRVEYTCFTDSTDSPWNQFITGNLSMKLTSKEIVVDDQAPKFDEGMIQLKNAGGSFLELYWPAAHDNITEDDALEYQMYISETPFKSGEIPSDLESFDAYSTGGTLMKLKGETAYYVAVVVTDLSYNKAMISGGPFKTTAGAEKNDNIYEVYDYLDQISEKLVFNQQVIAIDGMNTPWTAQVLDSDGVWKNLNRATRLEDLIYCNISTPQWAGYYPGMSFLAPQKASVNRCLARLNPCKAAATVSANFDYTVAYSFTAPYAGKYTFEKGNSEFAYNEMFDGKFAIADSGSANLTLGVRITLNDEVIWPLENTECNKQDGWATICGHGKPSGSIPIPTISNIKMIAGDQLRVEARAFDATENAPWLQQVSANVRMIINEKTIDKDPPVFNSTEIKQTAKTTTSMTISWPLASDVLSNDSSIQYKLYYDTNPIAEERISSLDGLNVRGGSQRLTLLESDTDYYIAIVATDISGNSAMIVGGPFRTDSNKNADGNTPDSPDTDLPNAPLNANKSASESGIVSSGGGSVTVGWIANNSMSFYRVYLFSKNGSSYNLVKNSNALNASISRYTFSGLENENYYIQVVGYNSQGQPFEIFSVIELNNASGAAANTDHNGEGSSLIPSPITGIKENTVTTYIKEEGQTQIQDVYETVNNTKTITTGPSVAGQILWVVLLIVGGIMLIASGLLLFLLLKKSKHNISEI